MTTEQKDGTGSRVLSTDELGVMSEAELAENNAWLERNGGHVLPPGLHEGGLWLMVIREEIQKALTNDREPSLQVLRQPPTLLRWMLKPWLRFPSRRAPE